MFGRQDVSTGMQSDPAATNQSTDFAVPGQSMGAPASTDYASTTAPAVPAPSDVTTQTFSPAASPAPADPTYGVTSATPSGGDSGDLLDIKQQALQQLSPLVGHLDQTPEEKFRTTMMMIQAADNQDLIKEAYEAAKQITDEKARAQALLDVVNEINYFTHNNEQQQ